MKTIVKLLSTALAALPVAAYAHHPMGGATPATALEGLLSGLGHPVIGIDHLAFIIGAGVLAAKFARGWLLPLIFVFASTFTVMLRYFGADASLGEFPVAGSVVLLGLMMLAVTPPRQGVIGVMFLAAGTIHGHALGEAIIGAERAPLLAYLVGLAVIQSAIALSAWRIATLISARRPRLPVQALAGALVAVTGFVFVGLAAL